MRWTPRVRARREAAGAGDRFGGKPEAMIGGAGDLGREFDRTGRTLRRPPKSRTTQGEHAPPEGCGGPGASRSSRPRRAQRLESSRKRRKLRRLWGVLGRGVCDEPECDQLLGEPEPHRSFHISDPDAPTHGDDRPKLPDVERVGTRAVDQHVPRAEWPDLVRDFPKFPARSGT